jgi:restriction system protein
MLGKQSIHATSCFNGNFIGTDFDLGQDLTNKLPEDSRVFNKEFIPKFIEIHPGKNKISAGLACGALWTVSKGIKQGDIVLCPEGTGRYRVGEVNSDYNFVSGSILQHQRAVKWLDTIIERSEMSEALKRSTGSIGTVAYISGHREEIEKLICGTAAPLLATNDESIEDLALFAMEKHLEDFLVQNWAQTELGKLYDIFEENGERVGQQYPTDSGPMDILAISKDKKTLLVVELKKGRASDAVVGQVLRYMGYMQQELAEPDQTVRGIIIALEDDQRIRRALAVTPNIEFYRYQISFKLMKA